MIQFPAAGTTANSVTATVYINPSFVTHVTRLTNTTSIIHMLGDQQAQVDAPADEAACAIASAIGMLAAQRPFPLVTYGAMIERAGHKAGQAIPVLTTILDAKAGRPGQG